MKLIEAHSIGQGVFKMKQFFKDFYEALKLVQQARAEAILKGQHWY